MNKETDPPPRPLVGRTARHLAAVLLFLTIGPYLAASPGGVRFPLPLQDPVSGGDFKLDGGHPATHLVFVATWCPPCRDELPRLAELEARWGDRGYRLVLVAVPNRQTRERLAQWIRDEQPPGRVAFDSTGAVGKACEVGDLPTHLVIDAAGKIVHRSSRIDAGVERAVAGLLGR